MNSINPKVSILMPVFNGEKYLEKAIESIIFQTEKDWELIIVDDGSTDSTPNIINSFNDSRIKYFKKEHGGIVKALNFGISKARAKYIARMDSDDISFPNRIEKQIKFMEENNFVVSGSYADVIDCLDNKIDEIKYLPLSWNKIKIFSFLHNPFIHPSVIFDREVFLKAGGYRNFKHIEDYELWTRIIYKNKVGNIPESLVLYRKHEKQITKKFNTKMRIFGIVVRLLALWRFVFRF